MRQVNYLPAPRSCTALSFSEFNLYTKTMTSTPSKIKILHIAGAGRSGSTIIEKALGSTRNIVALGEVSYLWERGFIDNTHCGCGQPFHECAFWSQVLDYAGDTLSKTDSRVIMNLARSVSRFRHLPLYSLMPFLPSFRKKVGSYGSLLQHLYEAAAKASASHVVIDSSKHVHGHVLASMPDIDLYVVHIVRDGRATAHSWTRRKKYDESGDTKAFFPTFNPLYSAAQWLFDNLSAEYLRIRTKNSIRIRYEDFTNDPESTLSTILSFINENDPPPTVNSDKSIKLEVQHSVSGNPVRFTSGNTKILPDVEWKTKMPFWSRIAVSIVAWPMLLRYKYYNSPIHDTDNPENDIK